MALNDDWRKSSRSGSENCVEVRLSLAGGVQIRDSNSPGQPTVEISREAWMRFLHSLR